MGIFAPCKNCEDREVGCHSKCLKYILFRRKLNRVNAKKQQEHEIDNMTYEGHERLHKQKSYLHIYKSTKH